LLNTISRYLAFVALVVAVGAWPSISAAQEATPAPEPQREPLINAYIRGMPSPPAIVALVKFTFAPGAVFPEIGAPGPVVIRVVAGGLTIRFPGEPDEIEENGVELAVISPSATLVPATPSSNPNVLAVRNGEQISIPADVPHDIHNDSSTPAVFYATAMTTLPPDSGGPLWPPAGIGPESLPTGVTAESLDVGYDVVATLPPAPVEMTLDRLTLPPGTALPDRAGNDLVLLAVEDGELHLIGDNEILVRRGAGGPSVSSTPEADLLLAAGDSALVQPGTGVTGRNVAAAPLVVLQLMIAPAVPPAATPAAGTPTST